MNKNDSEAFTRNAAKDLNVFSQILTKITVKAVLKSRTQRKHLGYKPHQPSDNANSRNRHTSSKTLKTEDDQFELNTPRDRDDSFWPQLVKKG